MTPIVFWASCRPCPRAMAEALKVCAIRNPRLTRAGLARRNPHRMVVISVYASRNPTSGDTTIGTTTFSRMPAHCTTPTDARVAPTSPPIRAYDDDDGRPNHQVMRFQVIAPIRAASTTTRLESLSGSSTMPAPIV